MMMMMATPTARTTTMYDGDEETADADDYDDGEANDDDG